MGSYVALFVLIPLLGAILMPWASRLHRRAADSLALVASAVPVGLCAAFLGAGATPAESAIAGTHLALDALSLLFLVVVNLVAFCCLLYSIDYIEHYGGRGKFFALLLLLVAGLNGIVLVRDLFSLYLFLEVASVASFVLVAFSLEWDGIESALKYLLLSVVATAAVLLGIALVYAKVGTLQFAGLKAALAGNEGVTSVFLMAAALFVAGFGLKAAAVPFHAWLPDAHPSAPAPISAMLSGVVIKVAGVYALIRLFFDIYPAPAQVLKVLLVLGVASVVLGAVVAFFQRDIKRMFAYSSISQIGYILVGLGLGNPLGIAGALFHIFNHATFKSLLFLNSGALQHRTGTRNIEEMGGLESRMPVTGVTSIFGTLSLAGVPPFNGFWSKLLIVMGAVAAKNYTVAFLAVLVSIFTLGYLLLMQRRVFFGTLNLRWQDVREAPATMVAAMITLAGICLLSGVLFDSVLRSLIEPAAMLLVGGK
jgi:multicomponent Na+:H+ antiporter subunit D